MSVSEWLTTLNNRVFFWLQERRRDGMLGARPYRGRPHTVLVVETAKLLAEHVPDVRLSRINSGATLYTPPLRGMDTFKTIEEYDHPPRRRALASCSDIAELAVFSSVPAIDDMTLRVERRQVGVGVLEVLLERD